MKQEFVPSDNEYEILDLLWREKRPLSKADIIELSPNKSWKTSSIYVLLNSMLKKGAIKEEGFVKSQTNYGRTFVPTLTEKEFVVMQINTTRKKRQLSLPELIVGMIDEETDLSSMKELEEIIQNKIKEMN